MKLDQLNGLIALVTLAEKKSFTQAAAELRVSPSAISQALKQLETRMGIALVHRTTRSVHLTEAGEKFIARCGPALKEVMTAVSLTETFSEVPSGKLRINLPRAVYPGVIRPSLAAFKKKFPQIELELFCDDENADIVKGGFDAGIRMSELLAKDMTAVRISKPFRFVVAGSPEYFLAHGVPRYPKALIEHDCIRYRYANGEYYERWEFEHRRKNISVEVKGSLIVNDPGLLTDAAVSGLGLVYHTEDSLHAPLKAGKLKIVLEEYAPQSEGYFIYFSKRSQVLPKLRAFIDFFRTRV